jgi:uncharacterized protein YciI
VLYAIIGHDHENSLTARQSARQKHLDRLRALQHQGRLVLAGPFPAVDEDDPGPAGFTGSLIVAEFASLSEAQDWAQSDPYVAAGVYERVTVRTLKQVLP